MESQRKSMLSSILQVKCPRCREGNMFPAGTLYSSKFADMHANCPCCGQTFEPEPGYYYGAMYVSFGFSTAIFLGVLAILYLFVDELSTLTVGIAVLIVMLGLLPISFRLARTIWIHIFIRYEGPCHAIPKK